MALTPLLPYRALLCAGTLLSEEGMHRKGKGNLKILALKEFCILVRDKFLKRKEKKNIYDYIVKYYQVSR